jgi:hypothetical protein
MTRTPAALREEDRGSGARLGPVVATSFFTSRQWRGGRGATGGGAREDGEVRGSSGCGKEGAGARGQLL